MREAVAKLALAWALADTLQEMATTCSVPMELWDRHSNLVLKAIESLRIEASRQASPSVGEDDKGFMVLHAEPAASDQIKHMVNRFLGWRLPDDFSPDAGTSFKPTFNDHLPQPTKHNPVGTNLLSYTQAEAMVRYMLDGLQATLARPDRETTDHDEAQRVGGRDLALGAATPAITHADACRLSRAFNEASDLRSDEDRRINEWLKELIVSPKVEESLRLRLQTLLYQSHATGVLIPREDLEALLK